MPAEYTITGNVEGDTAESRSVYVETTTNVANPTENIDYKVTRHLVGSNGVFTIPNNPAHDPLNLPYSASGAQHGVKVTFGQKTWVIPAQADGATVSAADFTEPWAVPPRPAQYDEVLSARDQVLAKVDANDDLMTTVASDPGSDFSGVLSAATAAQIAADGAALFSSVKGANIARYITRAQAGEALTITILGDSVAAGQTVTTPATDGFGILLPADLHTRFGNTNTATNRAVGGRTLLTAHTFSDVANALADKADLYIISYAKNDSQIYFGTQGGEYGPGYQRGPSIAALERIVRRIRDRVPKADIILMSENPYAAAGGSTTNPPQQLYQIAMRRLAAIYGCEWVDIYQVFLDKGNYTSYTHADGVHPNTLGHRLIADTLLEHFPANFNGPVNNPGAPSKISVYSPGQVDAAKGFGGYVTASATSVAGSGLTFAKTGAGWAGTSPHATSGAGDYIEYTFSGTELHLNISCALADSPIFDVAVDGVTVKSSANPLLAGGRIDYYVPVAVGLTAAAHVVRITLVSGTLKINQAAALLGPGTDLTGEVVTVDLTGTPSVQTLSTGGTASTLVNDTPTVPLPAGWSVMNVELFYEVSWRTNGQTTTPREFQVTLRNSTNGAGVIILRSQKTGENPVDTGVQMRRTTTYTYLDTGKTADQKYRLEVFATATDKTNQFVDTWSLKAVCRRVA